MAYGNSIALNDANDFTFNPKTNTLSLVYSTDNLIQAIKILLKTGIGEIRTFPTFGIDMPQLLDKNISDDNVKHAIHNAVIKDPRVKSIDKILLNRVNRVLNVSMQITAYDGALLDFRESVSW